MEVGIVDYTDEGAPNAFAETLARTGFAVLVNHPLPWTLVEEMFAQWGAFFKSDAKFHYVPEPGEQGGYFGPATSETAKGQQVRDLKEFFHVYPDSTYPREVGDAALRYQEHARQLAQTLLGWLQACTKDDVRARFSRPLPEMLDGTERTLLRILRYPAIDGSEPAGAVRAAAHEDINLLTVLPSSDEPGLELLDAEGRWHAVPCDPGSLAVNAGEMLQLLSGGHYPATTHRVVNPSGPDARRARMAAPLFLHPTDDTVLADGRTAISFHRERIRELRGVDLR